MPKHKPLDKILITNLRVRGILGIKPEERKQPQEILVNVVVFTDTKTAASSDSIEDCIDYAGLSKEIRALIGRARRYTVEALAEDIADLCLGKTGADRTIVRVEKTEAVTGADSAGVEIIRP